MRELTTKIEGETSNMQEDKGNDEEAREVLMSEKNNLQELLGEEMKPFSYMEE